MIMKPDSEQTILEDEINATDFPKQEGTTVKDLWQNWGKLLDESATAFATRHPVSKEKFEDSFQKAWQSEPGTIEDLIIDQEVILSTNFSTKEPNIVGRVADKIVTYGFKSTSDTLIATGGVQISGNISEYEYLKTKILELESENLELRKALKSQSPPKTLIKISAMCLFLGSGSFFLSNFTGIHLLHPFFALTVFTLGILFFFMGKSLISSQT